MDALITTLSPWLAHAERYAAELLALSVVTLLMSFVLLPVMITRLPANYFRESHRPRPLSQHLAVHLVLTAIKNLIGLGFVLLGIVLMFLPGQGLLTLIIGLSIMNYPGKFALERWLVMRPHVLPALNWLRRRYGEPPLEDP